MTSDMRLVIDLDQENMLRALRVLSEAGISFKLVSVTSDLPPALPSTPEPVQEAPPDSFPPASPFSWTGEKSPDCVEPSVTASGLPPTKSLDYVTTWRTNPLGGSWISTSRTHGDLQVRMVPAVPHVTSEASDSPGRVQSHQIKDISSSRDGCCRVQPCKEKV